MIDIEFIRSWADVDGWTEKISLPHHVQFKRNKYFVNVYPNTGTVMIQNSGHGQHVYKKQTKEQIADILHDPYQFVKK